MLSLFKEIRKAGDILKTAFAKNFNENHSMADNLSKKQKFALSAFLS